MFDSRRKAMTESSPLPAAVCKGVCFSWYQCLYQADKSTNWSRTFVVIHRFKHILLALSQLSMFAFIDKRQSMADCCPAREATWNGVLPSWTLNTMRTLNDTRTPKGIHQILTCNSHYSVLQCLLDALINKIPLQYAPYRRLGEEDSKKTSKKHNKFEFLKTE